MPLVFDFRWKNDETTVFQVEDQGKFSEILIQKDQPFFLTLENNPLRCIGNLQSEKYVPCLNATIGTKKCEICKRMDDYFPCQFCNGFNCQQFREEKIENCDALHMVYLALFTKEIVKVGVSRSSRGNVRQVEQGSHFTRIFAEGLSGVSARRIEKTLTQMGFPDKILSSQKKEFLFPEITKEEGEKILEKKAKDATEFLLSHAPEYKKYILNTDSNASFWDLREKYATHFSLLQQNQKPFHFLSLLPGESIGGVLKMVKGAFLIVESPEEIMAFSSKDLVGYTVSFEECAMGSKTHIPLQSSLF